MTRDNVQCYYYFDDFFITYYFISLYSQEPERIPGDTIIKRRPQWVSVPSAFRRSFLHNQPGLP